MSAEKHYYQHLDLIYNDIVFVFELFNKRKKNHDLNFIKPSYLNNINIFEDKILNCNINDNISKHIYQWETSNFVNTLLKVQFL